MGGSYGARPPMQNPMVPPVLAAPPLYPMGGTAFGMPPSPVLPSSGARDARYADASLRQTFRGLFATIPTRESWSVDELLREADRLTTELRTHYDDVARARDDAVRNARRLEADVSRIRGERDRLRGELAARSDRRNVPSFPSYYTGPSTSAAQSAYTAYEQYAPNRTGRPSDGNNYRGYSSGGTGGALPDPYKENVPGPAPYYSDYGTGGGR